MVKCTKCGCSWDGESGYYHCHSVLQQPCRECRLEAKSINYLNNRDSILEAQRTAYYNDHKANKAYHREYQRSRSIQAPA